MVTCMKRWGVWAASISPDTKADAGQKPYTTK
jgi:hypothetical protein